MDIRQKIEQFGALELEIHEYFGYVEDWVKIPLESRLEDYWMLLDGAYAYSPKPFTEESINAGTNTYSGRIYTQRFLPKWVYRALEMTMVCADTQTDGNKFLFLFDNSKECTDNKLKQLYEERWNG